MSSWLKSLAHLLLILNLFFLIEHIQLKDSAEFFLTVINRLLKLLNKSTGVLFN